MLFTLKCTFPDTIFLIRGNHEFACINSIYGFQKEVESVYGNDLVFRKINEVFTWLPLVTIVNDTYFCVHGGISPLLQDLTQLTKIERPILDYSGNDERDQIIADLVWSDPSTTQREFTVNPRGIGKEYGYHSIAKFLMNNKLRHVFRAHQSVIKGIADHCNGVVTTIFSSSFITPTKERHFCGILFIDERSNVQSFTVPPLKQPIIRILACFKPAIIPGIQNTVHAQSNHEFHLKFGDITDTNTFNSLYSKKRKTLFTNENRNGGTVTSLLLFNKKLSQSQCKMEVGLPKLKK